MSRPIHAAPRLGFGAAIVLLLGALFAEIVVVAVGQVAYRVLSALGGGVVLVNPGIDTLLELASKVLVCTLVVWLALRRTGEPWSSLGRATFSPWVLVIPWFPVIGGVVIFLSEIDNLSRAFLPPGWLDNWAPGLDSIAGTDWLGPLLLIVVGPAVEEILFRGL